MRIDLDDIESRINDGIYGDDRMSNTARDDAFSALAEIIAEVERLRLERAEWARRLVEAKKEGARSAVAEREAERAAVVAWLRDYAVPGHSDEDNLAVVAPCARTVGRLADAIERGAHIEEIK